MTEAPNNDFKSINFPSLVHQKYFWRTSGQNHQLGWRHRSRQKIRAEFTLKELLELQKRFHLNDINSIIYRQAIFLDKTLFEIHEFWKQKYNSRKLTFAITGWRLNLPGDIVQNILEYLPSTGSSPSGPWKNTTNVGTGKQRTQ